MKKNGPGVTVTVTVTVVTHSDHALHNGSVAGNVHVGVGQRDEVTLGARVAGCHPRQSGRHEANITVWATEHSPRFSKGRTEHVDNGITS